MVIADTLGKSSNSANLCSTPGQSLICSVSLDKLFFLHQVPVFPSVKWDNFSRIILSLKSFKVLSLYVLCVCKLLCANW